MLPVTPAELRIDRQALTVLRRILAAAFPCEGCALLLGRRQAGDGGPLWRLERIWPCLNVWEPARERTRRFQLDPREQLLAQKWARARSLEVLGAAHSHPCGEPTPSPSDRALTLGPTLMLILGGSETGDPADGPLGCWWLEDHGGGDAGTSRVRPLPWRMDD